MAIAFIAFAVYGVKSVVHLKGNYDSSQIRLKNNQVELKNLNTELEKEKADKNASQENIQKLEQEKKDLEAQLQAKIEQKSKIAQAAKDALNKATFTQTAYAATTVAYSGSHADWMASAGIAPGDYTYVEYIVSHESGWNPSAVNASSGACGLGQQLPCGKWAGAWNDPVAALVAMQGYALGRYGSWASAYNYWITNHWW